MKKTIKQRVTKIIVKILGVSEEEVSPESNFIDDLGADSLDLIDLIMAMEDEFGMEISDEEVEKILTVQNVIDHITKNRSDVGE